MNGAPSPTYFFPIFVFMDRPLFTLLLLLLLYLTGIPTGSAQSSWSRLQGRNLVELRQALTAPPTLPVSYARILPAAIRKSGAEPSATTPVMAVAPVPAAWRYRDLAPFCKLEVKMEKALNLPIKVRLGEVQAVERKEGKLKTHFAERRY